MEDSRKFTEMCTVNKELKLTDSKTMMDKIGSLKEKLNNVFIKRDAINTQTKGKNDTFEMLNSNLKKLNDNIDKLSSGEIKRKKSGPRFVKAIIIQPSLKIEQYERQINVLVDEKKADKEKLKMCRMALNDAQDEIASLKKKLELSNSVNASVKDRSVPDLGIKERPPDAAAGDMFTRQDGRLEELKELLRVKNVELDNAKSEKIKWESAYLRMKKARNKVKSR